MFTRLTQYKGLAALLAAIVLAAAGLIYALTPPAVKKEQVPMYQGKRNIMVLGVDRRIDDVGRSDTLFVAMLDTQKNRISLLSVPRDTLVKIPGHGWDKVNHAYAFGGHALSQKTLEGFLGIPINNYLLVDFRGFVDLVNAIGGVDIDVEKPMQYQDPYDDNGGVVVNLQPGRQHMDGTTAIQYVRYRDEEGDIGRVRRQQKFMQAIFAKLRGTNLVTKAPEIAQALYKSVETDLSAGDLLSLLVTFTKNVSGTSRLETAMVQGSPAYLDDISYWIPNMTALRQQLALLSGVQATETYRQKALAAKREYDELLGTNSAAAGADGKQQLPIKTEALKQAVERTRKMEQESKETPAVSPSTENDKPQEPVGMPPQPVRQPLRVSIVNCSEKPQNGERAAEEVRSAGFTVVSTSTGSPVDHTQVLINASSSLAASRAQSLPFAYQLLRGSVSPATGDMIIYLGRDYEK